MYKFVLERSVTYLQLQYIPLIEAKHVNQQIQQRKADTNL